MVAECTWGWTLARVCASTAYRHYRASLARGDTLLFQAMRRKEPPKYFRRAVLDVHFIYTLPVLVTSRHSRASGNPGGKSHGDWMPAFAGMTFYWRRTDETDI